MHTHVRMHARFMAALPFQAFFTPMYTVLYQSSSKFQIQYEEPWDRAL